MTEAKDQGLGGWKGEINQGASLTKKGLVGAINRSGRKLDILRPGTVWVEESKLLGGGSNQGVSVAEREIGEKGIGERVIGERANLGTSDWEVIEIKNTVRNE